VASPDNSQFEPEPLGGEGPNRSPAPVLSTSETQSDPSLLTQSRTHSAENPAWSGWDVLAMTGLALVTIFLSQLVIFIGAHYLLYPRTRLSDLGQRERNFVERRAVAFFLRVGFLLEILIGHAADGRGDRRALRLRTARRRCEPRRSATATITSSTDKRPGRPWRSTPTGSSASCAPTRRPRSRRGSPSF